VNSSLRIALATNTLALMAGCIFGKTGSEIAPACTLSIRLYNSAQVPAGVLHSAIEQSTRLFRADGIRTVWDQPAIESPEDQGTDMTSPAFQQPDPRRYIVVRLVRREPTSVFPDAIGHALPFARTGAHVVIFCDRVQALTARVNAASYIVLGYAMAHEIGHVLLGSSEHSDGGLMQARWTAATWRLACAGLLAFGREESERMHLVLRTRPTPWVPEADSMGASIVPDGENRAGVR
jgi:hypothetical protein